MVDLVLVNHFCLLHSFHCDYFATFYMSADPNFSESSSADNREWFEVSGADLLPHFPVQLCFFVQDVLLNELLLCPRKVQFLHFVL